MFSLKIPQIKLIFVFEKRTCKYRTRICNMFINVILETSNKL